MDNKKTSDITPAKVKELRELTGAGMMNCKNALVENNGNVEKSLEYLRQKGQAFAQKKSLREVKEGIVESYIHFNGKIGVLVELNCETDFVARRIEFKELSKNIAMQIASSNTIKYISKKEIPIEFIEQEKAIELKKDDLTNKPLEIKEKIIEGRIDKILQDYCLLNQPFIKNPSITIDELIKENIALLGENLQVSRFIKYNLGEK